MLENIANPKWFPLVDGDEKPIMGYLYEAMDKAKEEIKKRLKNKVSL